MDQQPDTSIELACTEIEKRFGATLICHFRVDGFYRDDVWFATLLPGLYEPDFPAIRLWLESRGVVCLQRDRPDGGVMHYLATMQPVTIAQGFHATTRRRWEQAIRHEGLLPGSRADRRRMTERLDCEGNIYLCERLGEPADANQPHGGSAYWWSGEISRTNTDGDRDCVVLEVHLRGLSGLLTYRDLFSESGVIVRGVSSIPPTRLLQRS